MTALLSTLVQLASLVAGFYLALHGKIALGIGMFLATQLLHWVSRIAIAGLLWLHERYLMSPASKFKLELVAEAPPLWEFVTSAIAWLYIIASGILIWLALSR